MSDKTIKTSVSISAVTIFLCWLTVFLFPAVTFRLCLDWLFDLTYQTGCRAAQREMVNEMTAFRDQARTVPSLERMLRDFCRENTHTADVQNPEKFRERLLKTYGIPAALCITHGKDSEELEFFIQKDFSDRIKVFPRKLTQKALFAFNNQHQHCFFSKKNEAATKRIFEKDGSQEVFRSARLFLKQHFALIAEMPLLEDRVIKTISGRLGGPVYFYYHAFRENINGRPGISNGVLLLLAGNQLNYRQILENSLVSENARVTRSFARLPVILPGQYRNDNSIFSHFVTGPEGFTLKGMLSQEMVADLIQRGTLFPLKFSQTLERMPVLEVTTGRALMQHPLTPYNRLINLLLRLFVAGGGIFLLHMYFFGLQFLKGVRQKIIIGLFFILLLPGSLVLVAMLTWFESGRLESRYLTENRLKNISESFQQKFQDYLTSAQFATLQLTKRIEEKAARIGSKELEAELQKFLENSDAHMIGCDDLVYGPFYLSTSEAKGVFKNEEDMLKTTSRTVLNSFRHDGGFDINLADAGNSFTTVHPSFINEILSFWGRLVEFGRFSTGNRFSIVPVLFPGMSSPRAFIIACFSQKNLIRGFVRNKIQGSYDFPGLKIFFFEKQVGGHRFFDGGSGKTVTDSATVKSLDDALKGSDIIVSDFSGGIRFQQVLVDFPVILQIDGHFPRTGSDRISDFALLATLAILLFSFAWIYFGRIYLEPVHEFTRITRLLFAGNYQVSPNIFSVDEFGELKKAFDSMIEGIYQKEKMSQFVSAEVLQTINDESSATFQPDGERIEATISFVRFPALNLLKDPEKIAEKIGQIIELVEKAAASHGGIIDKIIEDTVMLVFRKPSSHAVSCCNALIEIKERAEQLEMKIEAGIATGEVVMGRIGSRLGKLDFTVIGDAVNLAARLKAHGKKAVATGIIIAPSTIRKVKGQARVAFIDRVEIKGKSRAFQLYELAGLR
ncbi:MAG: adenylate/guanylate cyclase domain-containing protein [Candidatus Rifleibacteriota bacterium]